MKKQIRRGVFETNSSSIHSLIMCMKSDYDRWEDDNLYLYMGYGYGYLKGEPEENHFYTRDEAIAFEKSSIYASEDTDWTNDEVVNTILHERQWYDYGYFWDEYCEYYETFEEETTTPSGETVVAFGYYGMD